MKKQNKNVIISNNAKYVGFSKKEINELNKALRPKVVLTKNGGATISEPSYKGLDYEAGDSFRNTYKIPKKKNIPKGVIYSASQEELTEMINAVDNLEKLEELIKKRKSIWLSNESLPKENELYNRGRYKELDKILLEIKKLKGDEKK